MDTKQWNGLFCVCARVCACVCMWCVCVCARVDMVMTEDQRTWRIKR